MGSANVLIKTETINFDNATHRYTVAGLERPSVTRIISDMKLAPPYPEDDPKGLKPFGTACHRAADLLIWDRLDIAKTDPRIQPRMEGLAEKVREMRIVPIKTEMRVYHDEMGYAGTLDLLCRIYDEELAVIDYKAGVPPTCVEIQLALYVMAVRRMTGMTVPIRRFSMQLTPGRAVVRECRDDFDYHAAQAAVTLWKWKNDRRKA